MCSLPRLIDKKEDNGEITPGVYPAQMTDIIGEGAYDSESHMNTQLLWATEIGPHPMKMHACMGGDAEGGGLQLWYTGRARIGPMRKAGTTGGADSSDSKKQRGSGEEK